MKEHDDAVAVRQAFAEAEGVLRGLEAIEVGDGTAVRFAGRWASAWRGTALGTLLPETGVSNRNLRSAASLFG